MSLLNDEYLIAANPNSLMKQIHGDLIKVSARIREDDYPLSDNDAALVISVFEKESIGYNEDAYALVTHYKDVHSTRNFSERVRKQMEYYPGIHKDQPGTQNENPFFPTAEEMAKGRMEFWNNSLDSPDAFMGALRQKTIGEDGELNFDYGKIFGSDTTAKEKAIQVGKMLTECIPCFDRLLDLDGLVPDGDLLELHLLNIKLRTDILDKILDLFRNPGMFVDICELLKLLSGLCPQDLLALLALLTQYLAKLNLDFEFNLDFILNLVGPILSPFLDALAQWLDKWVQMILGPIICITDHINEVIYMLNTIKISAKNASVDVNGEINLNFLGFTGPSGVQSRIDTGASMSNGGTAWSEGEISRLETPPDTRYKQYRPDWPNEEIEMSREEMGEAWNPSLSQQEREEKDKEWADLRKRRETASRELTKLPGIDREMTTDGTRWSGDDRPLTEKKEIASFSKGMQNHPPEKQAKPTEAISYFDSSPLVNSIVQLRNIVQAAIRYVQDWFKYAVQMIYDLLGVDFGWLSKKGDNSFLKSRIIQMILMIKSLIEAISKNGLQCGVNSNFDVPQMRFIIETSLNKFSTLNKFKVRENGDIEVYTDPSGPLPTVESVSSQLSEDELNREANTLKVSDKEDPLFGDTNKVRLQSEQKIQKSGIIVKNCLRDMTKEEIDQARQWISEYERRLSQYA